MPRCRANGLKRGPYRGGGKDLFLPRPTGPEAQPIQYRGGGGGGGWLPRRLIAPSAPPDAAPIAAPVPPPTAAPAPAPFKPPPPSARWRGHRGLCRPTDQALTPTQSRPEQETPSSRPYPSRKRLIQRTNAIGSGSWWVSAGNTWLRPPDPLRLLSRIVLRRNSSEAPRHQDCCSVAPPSERGGADSLDLGPPYNRDHGPPSGSYALQSDTQI
jgi:hypothetical protein